MASRACATGCGRKGGNSDLEWTANCGYAWNVSKWGMGGLVMGNVRFHMLFALAVGFSAVAGLSGCVTLAGPNYGYGDQPLDVYRFEEQEHRRLAEHHLQEIEAQRRMIDEHNRQIAMHQEQVQAHGRDLERERQYVQQHPAEVEAHRPQIEEHQRQIDSHNQQIAGHQQMVNSRTQLIADHQHQADEHTRQADAAHGRAEQAGH